MNEPEKKYAPDSSVSKRNKIVIVLMAMMACLWAFGIKPMVDDYNEIGKIITPGFHFKSLFPFIHHVSEDEVAMIYDRTGEIVYYPVTNIPNGHVGVLTERTTGIVQPKILEPGVHRINPEMYDVSEVYTGKQTWKYGGDD